MEGYKISLLAFAFITTLLSCDFSHSNNTSLKNSPDGADTCTCSKAIGSQYGDKPILLVNFSNHLSIIICGFIDKEMEGIIVSEFNVFECRSGNSLAEYGAHQICSLVEKADSLLIQEQGYLPVGQNWQWELIQIGEQVISLHQNRLQVSERRPKTEPFSIDRDAANNFLDQLEKGLSPIDDKELTISKLEALSIQGNERAKQILFNYEKVVGQRADGHIAETLHEAVDVVKWIAGSKF